MRTKEQVALIERSRELFVEIGDVVEPDWASIVDRVIMVPSDVACDIHNPIPSLHTDDPHRLHLGTDRYCPDVECQGQPLYSTWLQDGCWADISMAFPGATVEVCRVECGQPEVNDLGLCISCHNALASGARRWYYESYTTVPERTNIGTRDAHPHGPDHPEGV